jgi:hypothetical protein
MAPVHGWRYIGVMGSTLIAWLFALSVAEEQPRASAPQKPAAQSDQRKLDLGPYGAPAGGTPKVEALTDTPRFESSIDVEGRAPADFNQTMSVWWAHFNFTSPSVYGRGTAFRAPPPNGSVDITPLVGWVADKVRDYKRNRRKAPRPEGPSSPTSSPSPAPTPSPSPTPEP